ncbi:hypothetical protein D3C87_1340480 [compost metagenome]
MNLALPTGSNWNEHWSGSATTVTGFFSCATKTSGLPYWVSALKIGKYVSAARMQPAMMIPLRPMRSDRLPKITKNGVPISSEPAISKLAVCASIFSVCRRKNSA